MSLPRVCFVRVKCRKEFATVPAAIEFPILLIFEGGVDDVDDLRNLEILRNRGIAITERFLGRWGGLGIDGDGECELQCCRN